MIKPLLSCLRIPILASDKEGVWLISAWFILAYFLLHNTIQSSSRTLLFVQPDRIKMLVSKHLQIKPLYLILSLSQIITRFGFLRFIVIIMFLHIVYVYMIIYMNVKKLPANKLIIEIYVPYYSVCLK